MCHAVAAAAPAVHCNGIQPYRGAAWEEGRLLLLSSRGVINYLLLGSFSNFDSTIIRTMSEIDRSTIGRFGCLLSLRFQLPASAPTVAAQSSHD